MKLKYLMAFILLFSAQAWAIDWPFMVSVGGSHACALDTAGVVCWGSNEYGQTNVPVLKSPTQVSAGVTHTCALDSEGVKCWGDNEHGQSKVPKLKSPFMVSAGPEYTCALDATGVKCWGATPFSKDFLPALKSPTQISTAVTRACAVSEYYGVKQLKCWGSDLYSDSYVPNLESPTQVDAGSRLSCALNVWRVECWGDYSSQVHANAPKLKSPIQVSTRGNRVCALDAEGVKCWADYMHTLPAVPPLKNPTHISVGYAAFCAVDDDGVKCWGADDQKLTNVPNVARDLVRLAATLVSFARAEYLKAFSVLAPDIAPKTDYLRHLLVSPAILSVDSSFFTEHFVPDFKNKLKRFQNSLGYPSDIRKFPDAEAHRKLAIVSIRSALSVSLNFVSFDAQSSIQDAIRTAGAASADPMNKQKIRDLVKQVDGLKSEKRNLKSFPKSAFLVDTLELAANWLREKVK